MKDKLYDLTPEQKEEFRKLAEAARIYKPTLWERIKYGYDTEKAETVLLSAAGTMLGMILYAVSQVFGTILGIG